MKILFGITGSVAAKLARKIVIKLLEAGHEIEIVATESSFYFWNENDFNGELRAKTKIWRDKDEWVGGCYDPDIPIAHIELAKWADAFLIAPLTANTLGKMANGLADNLLTCVFRAWWEDGKPKPVIVAPAMNTRMWNNPVTARQIGLLKKVYGDDFHVVDPVSKKLACGETGVGAMADIDSLIAAIDGLKT